MRNFPFCSNFPDDFVDTTEFERSRACSKLHDGRYQSCDMKMESADQQRDCVSDFDRIATPARASGGSRQPGPRTRPKNDQKGPLSARIPEYGNTIRVLFRRRPGSPSVICCVSSPSQAGGRGMLELLYTKFGRRIWGRTFWA